MEQAAAAAGALQDQAASLAQAVSVFRLAGGQHSVNAVKTEAAPGAARPQRSAVVMRLQPRSKPATKAAAPARQAAVGDWEEF